MNKDLSESITGEVKSKLHELVDNLDIKAGYKLNHAGDVEVDVKFNIKEKPLEIRKTPVINTDYSKLVSKLNKHNKELMEGIIEENKKKYPRELDKYDLSK